jgi:hypothetical protein
VELVARETNVSIAMLSDWRERALAGAATALKERERDDRDDEIARLKSKVGEITMDNELLYAKIEALEGKRPLAQAHSANESEGAPTAKPKPTPSKSAEALAEFKIACEEGRHRGPDRPDQGADRGDHFGL